MGNNNKTLVNTCISIIGNAPPANQSFGHIKDLLLENGIEVQGYLYKNGEFR